MDDDGRYTGDYDFLIVIGLTIFIFLALLAVGELSF